jgi:hypothetical protein
MPAWCWVSSVGRGLRVWRLYLAQALGQSKASTACNWIRSKATLRLRLRLGLGLGLGKARVPEPMIRTGRGDGALSALVLGSMAADGGVRVSGAEVGDCICARRRGLKKGSGHGVLVVCRGLRCQYIALPLHGRAILASAGPPSAAGSMERVARLRLRLRHQAAPAPTRARRDLTARDQLTRRRQVKVVRIGGGRGPLAPGSCRVCLVPRASCFVSL